MNVFFHTVSALAMSSVSVRLFSQQLSTPRKPLSLVGLGVLLFGVSIAWHMVLDVTPHQYPFRSKPDIAISLMVFIGFCSLVVRRRFWWLFVVVFVGHLFPDLIDLGPTMLKEFTGWSIPSFSEKVFFCHREPWSGSIFDGSRTLESHSYHLLTVAIAMMGIIYGWSHHYKKDAYIRNATLR